MSLNEVWQHNFLMITFIVLVIVSLMTQPKLEPKPTELRKKPA